MSVVALSSIDHDGVHYERGEAIEAITDAQAKALVDAGAALPANAKAASEVKTQEELDADKATEFARAAKAQADAEADAKQVSPTPDGEAVVAEAQAEPVATEVPAEPVAETVAPVEVQPEPVAPVAPVAPLKVEVK